MGSEMKGRMAPVNNSQGRKSSRNTAGKVMDQNARIFSFCLDFPVAIFKKLVRL